VIVLIVRRLGSALATLFLVCAAVFLLIQLAPGSAVDESSDQDGFNRLTTESREELRRIYRLDRPLPVQFGLWLSDLARGDLGQSFANRQPVREKITERLGVTLTLNALALTLMIGLSVPLGTLAAWRPGSRLDRWTATGLYALYAIPAFWAGLLLQNFLSVRLGWFPVAGSGSAELAGLSWGARSLDGILHLVLPVLTLSYGGIAYLSRFVRATLLEQVGGETLLAVRARGLSRWVALWRHGFRLAAVPMLTLAGFLLPALFSGSVIVETLFSLHGVGRLFVDAALQRDVPVLMGLTLVSGATTLAGIVLADIFYVVFDPRVHRG